MFSLDIDQIKFWGNSELNFWRIFDEFFRYPYFDLNNRMFT
jgi:hypothetical protein